MSAGNGVSEHVAPPTVECERCGQVGPEGLHRCDPRDPEATRAAYRFVADLIRFELEVTKRQSSPVRRQLWRMLEAMERAAAGGE